MHCSLSFIPLPAMSVDKFGRHIISSNKGERGPKGEGFTFTEEGNFDVQNKRLCNVLNAKYDNDAVNLLNLKVLLKPCLQEVNEVFNFNNKTVTGIVDPKNDEDAVNLRVLKRKSVSETIDGHYDIQNKRLCNVKNAIHVNDAVNLASVTNLINPCMKEVKGVFNFKNKTVTGIEDPKNDLDAISLKVLRRNTLTLTNQGYNAKGKKITNVKAPENLNDVVVLKYLNDNCLITDSKKGIFNANNKIISHCSDPKDSQDVMTYNAMLTVISKLGWSIYNVLHKDKKDKLNFTDWFNIVKRDPYSMKTWDDALNLLEVKGNQIIKDSTPHQISQDGATGKTN